MVVQHGNARANTVGLTRRQMDALRAVWVRRGRACYYCGVGAADTVDHVVPLFRGGTNFEGNLVPCCDGCNNQKASFFVIELKAWGWPVAARLCVFPQGSDEEDEMGRATRPSEPLATVRKHGLRGWMMGCGCVDCRDAKRRAQARYRANAALPEGVSADEVQVPHDAGLFEGNVLRFLAGLGLESDEAKMLGDLMVFNAKLLDNIPKTERWHLSGPTQRTLLDLKEQLQKLKGADVGGEGSGAPAAGANPLGELLGGLRVQN